MDIILLVDMKYSKKDAKRMREAAKDWCLLIDWKS